MFVEYFEPFDEVAHLLKVAAELRAKARELAEEDARIVQQLAELRLRAEKIEEESGVSIRAHEDPSKAHEDPSKSSPTSAYSRAHDSEV